MKKNIKGVVKKISGEKTVKVFYVIKFKDKKYLKIRNNKCSLLVHDPRKICKVGDEVVIMECRPISKTKSFIIKYSSACKKGIENKETIKN